MSEHQCRPAKLVGPFRLLPNPPASPSPWTLVHVPGFSGGEILSCEGEREVHVATVYAHDGVENGPLIANAPGLYAALKWAVSVLDQIGRGPSEAAYIAHLVDTVAPQLREILDAVDNR